MNIASKDYTLAIGDKTVKVHPSKAELAAKIDRGGSGNINFNDIERFIASDSDGHSACNHSTNRNGNAGNHTALAREMTFSLANVANPDRSGYHSFAGLIQAFDKLSAANPNFVQKNVLGKTPEGRDIVAYKFSEGAQGDTSNKTGLVITGCHHAREWMTVEAPLKLGQDLLAGIDKDPAKQQRLKDSEIWIVPCANPDGYEYSRSTDSMWRKNRRPLEVDQLGKPTKEVGVDLNRNYGDGNPAHEYLWRPAGDLPGITSDDFSATSDNPHSETYRGPSSASEPETQAMVKLEVGHPNIKGCIDYHSYGDDIFYPWDHTTEAPPKEKLYKEICPKIAEATGWTWSQGSSLYLNAGDSTETQEINGIASLCFEMGQSFQPSPKLIPEITAKASAGTQVFIDEIIARDKNGELLRTA